MYFLIVGCSEAGYHLSKALLASEHEVAVVEKNPARHRILADELGSVAFAGDGTDEQTLKRAGITRADAVVAVTGRDATNLVICQIAKHVFQVPRTMVLVKDPKNEPLFHILGVDVVVNEIHQILLSFEEGVPGRPFVHLMNLQAPGRETGQRVRTGRREGSGETAAGRGVAAQQHDCPGGKEGQGGVALRGIDAGSGGRTGGGDADQRRADAVRHPNRGGVMPKRLAYLGPAGTYTEEAALLYDPAAELEPFPTIAAIGLAVSSEITDEGIVPIENSLEGSVTFTLDLLIQESQLSIYQEVLLPIDHYLMVDPGVKLADIEVVYSHPQSLAQCREFLETMPAQKRKQMASLSNSAAVADMQKSDVGAAAHSAEAGPPELYNAEIIGRKVQGLAEQT